MVAMSYKHAKLVLCEGFIAWSILHRVLLGKGVSDDLKQLC